MLLQRVTEGQAVVQAADAVSSSLGRLHSGTLLVRGTNLVLNRRGRSDGTSGMPAGMPGVVAIGSRALVSAHGRNRPRGRRPLLRGLRPARSRGCHRRGELRRPHQDRRNQSSGQQALGFLIILRSLRHDQRMSHHPRRLVRIGCPFRSSQ